MKDIISIISYNWDLVLLFIAVIEVFFRLIPTRKNYSLVDFIRVLMNKIHYVFDKYIPNTKINE